MKELPEITETDLLPKPARPFTVLEACEYLHKWCMEDIVTIAEDICFYQRLKSKYPQHRDTIQYIIDYWQTKERETECQLDELSQQIQDMKS